MFDISSIFRPLLIACSVCHLCCFSPLSQPLPRRAAPCAEPLPIRWAQSLSRQPWNCWTARPSCRTTTTDAAGNYAFTCRIALVTRFVPLRPPFNAPPAKRLCGELGQSRDRCHAGHADADPTGHRNRDRTPTPDAQVGAPVSVLTADHYRYSTEVQDPLRLIPGLR